MRFWNIVAVVLFVAVFLFVILFLLGCEPPNGRTGPTRGAIYLYGETDGVNTGWFAYGDALGNVIVQPGVRMDVDRGESAWRRPNGLGGYVYEPCPGVSTIEGRGITNSTGLVVLTGQRDWGVEIPGYVVVGAQARNPNHPTQSGYFNYTSLKYKDSPAVEAASIMADRSNRSIPLASAAPSNDRNLTDAEFLLLSCPTQGAPDTGFEISQISLVAQGGGGGLPIATAIQNPVAGNLIDADDYFFAACPMAYSIVIKTSNAVDLSGLRVMGGVRADSSPFIVPLEMSLLESSDDMQTHVIRTGWFLPVDNSLDASAAPYHEVYDRWTPLGGDPNDHFMAVALNDPNNTIEYIHRLDIEHPLYDPNALLPERVIQIPVLPVDAEGDCFNLSIDQRTLFLFVEYWMSEDKFLDLNGDGIVNFKDIVLYVKMLR